MSEHDDDLITVKLTRKNWEVLIEIITTESVNWGSYLATWGQEINNKIKDVLYHPISSDQLSNFKQSTTLKNSDDEFIKETSDFSDNGFEEDELSDEDYEEEEPEDDDDSYSDYNYSSSPRIHGYSIDDPDLFIEYGPHPEDD